VAGVGHPAQARSVPLKHEYVAPFARRLNGVLLATHVRAAAEPGFRLADADTPERLPSLAQEGIPAARFARSTEFHPLRSELLGLAVNSGRL
jgi:hypothetical protein